MANTSIFNAFERMWQHITTALNNKSDLNHNHTDLQEQLEGKSQVQIITWEDDD